MTKHQLASPTSSSMQLHNTIIFVLWLLLALGSLHAIITLYQGTVSLAYPYATTRIESFVLNGASRFAQGQAIYLGFESNPFIIHVYNPLTYLPIGTLGRLFNLSVEELLLAGRILSYCGTLLLAVSLAVWIRRLTNHWKYALFVALGIFFFQQFAATDFFRFRPEPLALLFTFLGVIAYQSQVPHRILLCAALLFTAFLFKQPFIAAPMAVLLHLIVEKDYRSATKFCAVMTGQLIAFFSLMYLVTGEHYFQNTFVAMSSNETSPLINFAIYAPLLLERSFALVLATPIAVFALLRLWPKHGFLLTYFFICAGWTFISAGKHGAGDNYFSELAILSILLIALAMANYTPRRPWVVSILLLLLSSQVFADWAREGIFTPTVKIRFENGGADITPYVSRYCGLQSNILILHEKIAVHCGKPIGLDWYLLDLLAAEQRVNLQSLLQDISRGKFQRIIFDQQPHSLIERKIFDLVKKGPFRRVYSDKVISEWAYNSNLSSR